MDIKLNLEIKQTQKLIMSQNLQMSLQMLQVSSLELKELIDQEMLQNPLLDTEDENQEKESQEEEEWERSEKQAEEWIEAFDTGFHSGSNSEYDPGQDQFEAQIPERPPTLAEYLIDQLMLLDLTEKERYIAEFIIDSLNENGFFDSDIVKLAEILDTDIDTIIRINKMIQTLDPPGIGAFDLRECLLIQLDMLFPEATLARSIVERFLNEFLNRKLVQIAKELHVQPAEVQVASDLIATLDPKPGSRFGRDYPQDISPDLIVHQIGEEFVVLYNDRSLPSVRINHAYRKLIKNKGDKQARKFVVEKFNAAKFLVKAIEQRRDTMIKVMTSIVRHQEGFLLNGISHLKPLTFAQVADDVERHESTVSRVVANKFVQTPRGTFGLKFFFSGGVITSDGGETSSRTVKNIITEIINQENPQKPNSDEKIVELLTEKGIKVARRTVAKYRKQLGILSQRLRKQYV